MTTVRQYDGNGAIVRSTTMRQRDDARWRQCDNALTTVRRRDSTMATMQLSYRTDRHRIIASSP